MNNTAMPAAALAALAFVPTACSHPAPPAAAPVSPPPAAAPVPTAPEPPAPPPMPPPDPSIVDRNSPDAVAEAVVAINYTVDTEQVGSWTDAARRARPLLSPDYADRLASPAPDAQWSTWSTHHAYTAVQLQPTAEPHPPDTPTTAARAVEITTTPYGRDSWHGDPERYEVFVTLTRTQQGWSATNLLAR